MKWTKTPGLSQEHMEEFFRNAVKPDSAIMAHGVIPRMQPQFVSCDFEKGQLEMAYEVMDWELNPEDMIHGGITSTAVDTSMGMLTHYYTQFQSPTVVTVTFNISFLKPILLGDTFHVHCQLDSLGRTLGTIKAEVRLERDDVLAAICTSTFMCVSK